MKRTKSFRVVVATDGSANARAAVAAAVRFPWPRGARAEVLVAHHSEVPGGSRGPVLTALDRNVTRIVANARRALARRWPDAEAVVARDAPAAAILAQSRRRRPGAIVVGWRGHGTVRRLLLGSVSRDVVRQASSPVLVVRRRPREFRTFVLGVDGSRHARQAAQFLATLNPPRGGQVTVIRVEEPMPMPPSAGRLPGGIRGIIRQQVTAINAERLARAQRDVDQVAARLARRGWRVRTAVRFGAPLNEVLGTVTAVRADALVVGARGTGGIKRLVLGSVAEGALNRSRVPVLIVR